MLKDLTAEVHRIKGERSSLQLTQENNELREEKASLKANIGNLTVQYQQRRMMMCPWTGVNSSSVMAPPYPYPVPLPVTTAPIVMHPSLQPYSTTTSNPLIEQAQPSPQYTSSSHTSSKRDSKSKSADHQRGSHRESNGSNDVRTKLELKNPGSSTNEVQFIIPQRML